jgi:hypothetical protein
MKSDAYKILKDGVWNELKHFYKSEYAKNKY